MELTRRELLKTGAAVAAAATVGPAAWATARSSASNPSDPGKRPNIMLIVTDQQFADAMSCTGNPYLKTPAMDFIAEHGVRFNNAYVNNPVCMPQRYSIFTGRLPDTRRYAGDFPKPKVSLGNIAKQGGYKTWYSGKWHIQDSTFSRDDTEFHGWDRNEGGRDLAMADDGMAFLKDHKPEDGPFITTFSFMNPHDICEWGRKADGQKDKIKMRNGEIAVDPPLDECPPVPDNYAVSPDEAEAIQYRRHHSGKSFVEKWDADLWRRYRWAYYRLVELVDTCVGKLLDMLTQTGHLDNTIIIFTSDHGDHRASHRLHQKGTLYEEAVRVPFIIAHPGQARKGETEDRFVSTGIDIMATICDIIGQPLPEGPYYGKSALPFVLDARSDAPTHEYVVCEAGSTRNEGYEGRTVRSRDFKYHLWHKGEHREQLFDMRSDRGELNNLAQNPDYAEVLNEHRGMLADWLERTDDRFDESYLVAAATK